MSNLYCDEARNLIPERILKALSSTRSGYPLPMIVNSLSGLSGAIWEKDTVLYDFTDHGQGHSRRILDYILRLNAFLPSNKRLSQGEWFVITVSALVHDAGMQWPFILRWLAPSVPLAENLKCWEGIRQAHATNSAELLQAIVYNNEPLAQAWPDLAYFKMKGDPSWNIPLGYITNVIRAHTRDHEGQETAWRTVLTWKDIMPSGSRGISALGCFRMRLVASLFRLADELDVTHHRVPELRRLLNEHPNISPNSLRYWASCYFIDEVWIDGNRFGLRINEAKLPHHDRHLKQVAEFVIHNLVHDKLRRTFLKGITSDTPSIQSVLSSYGMVLFIDEPEVLGGEVAGGDPVAAKEFLEIVLDQLKSKPFSGTVPINAYAIRGCASSDSFAEGREVRRVRLVDETRAVRVPERLRHGFLVTQTLQASRALTFLERSNNGDVEVLTYSENGQREFPAISAVLAAAAHLDKQKVVVHSGGIPHTVRQEKSNLIIDFGSPRAARLKGFLRSLCRPAQHPWRQIPLPYSRTEVAVLHLVELHGLHAIIWPPDHVLNPRLRNFLTIVGTERPGRDIWLQRAQILEDISRQILDSLPMQVATLSVLDENPPHSVLTYSTDTDSCITFSGGGMAAAGTFAIHYNHPQLQVTAEGGKEVVRLTAWYEPSQQFRVCRAENGSIELSCQVKRLLEGRLFL